MGTISKSAATSHRGAKSGTKTPGSKKRVPGESPQSGSRVEPSKVTDNKRLVREKKAKRAKK
jgi:hypothetical protein